MGSLRLVKKAEASPTAGEPEGDPVSADPKDLMEAVQGGDREAFEQLVEALWEGTLRFAIHMTGDPDHAYDITQVAFTRLWQTRERLADAGSVKVWLLRTARNQIVSDQRKKKVKTRWVATEAEEAQVRPRTPLEETERHELQTAIQQAVSELSPRRRESFTLCHLQGLSYREAAEIMEIRPQSVANYLQAAIANLRVALAPFYQSRGSQAVGSDAPASDC